MMSDMTTLGLTVAVFNHWSLGLVFHGVILVRYCLEIWKSL